MRASYDLTASPSLIALDWGTSSLRAVLLDENGIALDAHEEPWGIMRVPDGTFAAAFDAMTTQWRMGRPRLRAIAAGMIGSAQGWMPAPYCEAPAGAAELAASLIAVPDAALHIVPGVAKYGEQPDVMRGEETQIVGVLALHPLLATRSLLVLPGTHSKWVHVHEGKVADFTTFMTGELFAVLREHSILGRFVKDDDDDADPTVKEEAFARGVAIAQQSSRGMASTLFTARSMVLTQRLAAGMSVEYLSGLLIGEELRCGLADGAVPAALVGDAILCRRYAAALRMFGICDVPIIHGAAQRGLWSIAQHAGLIPTAS
ncbi:MAG: 2-dehydro-3-deoxygalactonokinase [bacterium]